MSGERESCCQIETGHAPRFPLFAYIIFFGVEVGAGQRGHDALGSQRRKIKNKRGQQDKTRQEKKEKSTGARGPLRDVAYFSDQEKQKPSSFSFRLSAFLFLGVLFILLALSLAACPSHGEEDDTGGGPEASSAWSARRPRPTNMSSGCGEIDRVLETQEEQKNKSKL